MVSVATADDLLRVEGKVDTALSYFKTFLVANKQRVTVTVKDIAKSEGVSESFLRSASGCYLLPRYGVSAYPDEASARWDIDEYITWRNKDPQIRMQGAVELNKRKSV